LYKKNSIWDFNLALGDAIAEKNQHLYVKIVEMNNLVNRKEIERKKQINNFWLQKKNLKNK
jgi:hypothetical protein